MSNIIKILKSKPKKINVGIIIQARMSSKRFPGKSMAILHEKPVLQWVLERALKIRSGKSSTIKVVLAAPDTEESETMLSLAQSLKVDNFCGSELDVLDRYYRTAKFFHFDAVLRLTADCPFIDPIVCSEVLQLLLWRKLDYTSNVFPKRTYPIGLDCEAFTFEALEAAHVMTKLPYDREHVTPWLQRTAELKRANVTQKIDVSGKNWCIDYPEDIQRLEQEIALKSLNLIGANDDQAT